MWAANSNGGVSLPTYAVKVVTHLEGEENPSVWEMQRVPNLPDVRSCCIANNVSHAMSVFSMWTVQILTKMLLGV